MGAFLEVSLAAHEAQQEVLVALLAEMGYESFWQEDKTLKSYVLAEVFDPVALDALCAEQAVTLEGVAPMPDTNWNAEWEQNYSPVEVGSFCRIRAPFHTPALTFQYELEIEPQMSFGTGHHATTQLMVQQLQQLEVKGKSILDIGCGTGVLGILALKMGAAKAVFVDVEDWAVQNAMQNLGRNGFPATTDVRKGGAEMLLSDERFDIILANINRNILQEDGARYVQVLRPGGMLVLSGFFDFDGTLIRQHYTALGVTEIRTLELAHWLSIVLEKV